VTFTPLVLLEELSRLEFGSDTAARYVVALSGGLDSMVLVHAMAELRNANHFAVELRCVHVDHGLHARSTDWRQFCTDSATSLGVDIDTIKVDVSTASGQGLEAAARDVRYRALQQQLQSGDWLLTAHHREDQAETLLLNLVRGSGPAGLAGIAARRRLEPGWLLRPMLNVDRAAIEQYANRVGLSWVKDPSNAEVRFDRNFLRHKVMPLLRGRWPEIAKRLQRSATHASEAADLLNERAAADLARIAQQHPARLSIDALSALTMSRQRNVIRYALRELNLSTPTTVQLEAVMTEVILAREDAQPLVRWAGTCVRRYRNGLYLLPENPLPPLQEARFAGDTLDLGAELGRLRLFKGSKLGLASQLVEGGLQVKCRRGGEGFRPLGQRHTRKLKNLLQEEGIVPWMRDRLPLVYAGEQLIAVGDLWISADVVTEPGVTLHWEGRPALH